MAASPKAVTNSTRLTSFGPQAIIHKNIKDSGYFTLPDTSFFSSPINGSSAEEMTAELRRYKHPYKPLADFINTKKISMTKNQMKYHENFLVLIDTAINYLSTSINDGVTDELLQILFDKAITSENRDEIISTCLAEFLDDWKDDIVKLHIHLKPLFSSDKEIENEVAKLILSIKAKLINPTYKPLLIEASLSDRCLNPLDLQLKELYRLNTNIKIFCYNIRNALNVYQQRYIPLQLFSEKNEFITKIIRQCDNINNFSTPEANDTSEEALQIYFNNIYQQYQSDAGKQYFSSIIFVTVYAHKVLQMLNESNMRIPAEKDAVSSLGLGNTRVPEIYKEINKLTSSMSLADTPNNIINMFNAINTCCNQFCRLRDTLTVTLDDMEKQIESHINILWNSITHTRVDAARKSYDQEIEAEVKLIIEQQKPLDFTALTFETSLIYFTHGYTNNKILDANIQASIKKDDGVDFINVLANVLIENNGHRKVIMDAICKAKTNKCDNQAILDKLYQQIIERLSAPSPRTFYAIARSKYAWHITLHQSKVEEREAFQAEAKQGSDSKGFIAEWARHLTEREEKLGAQQQDLSDIVISSPKKATQRRTSSSNMIDDITSFFSSFKVNGSVYKDEDDDFRSVPNASQ